MTGFSSYTAHWIAAARARESRRPDRLFDDPFAALLAGSAGASGLERSEAASGGENLFLPVRTKFFDNLILRFAPKIDQLVLLGAGFDTRAFRLALPDHLKVFEIDDPAIFAEKEMILSSAISQRNERRHLAPADLSGEWLPALLSAGFRRARPTMWLAEGLLFYLDREVVNTILGIAREQSGAGSHFAADIFGTGLLRLESMQPYLQSLATLGRPHPFCCDSPAEFLISSGWNAVEVTLAGERSANFGRLAPFRGAQGTGSNTMRTYLVDAQVGRWAEEVVN